MISLFDPDKAPIPVPNGTNKIPAIAADSSFEKNPSSLETPIIALKPTPDNPPIRAPFPTLPLPFPVFYL